MKLHRFLVTGLLAVLVCGANVQLARAEGTPPPPPGGKMERLKFLTPEEKDKFKKVREQVLTSNPSLKAEGEDLRKNHPTRDSSMDDKKAFKEKIMAHEKKVHDAMLQADPSVKPILDKMDAHRKEMRGKWGKEGGDKAPGTPAN